MVHDHTTTTTSSKGAYLSSMVAAIGGFLCGFDTGATGGVLTMAPFRQRFFTNEHPSSSSSSEYLEGSFLATYLMMAAIGSFSSGYFCDRWGRKYTIIHASWLFCMGNLCIAVGSNLSLVLVGRMLAGGAAGLMSNAIPIYQVEIAPPQVRGRLMSFFTLMSIMGQVAGYFVTFGTSYLMTSTDWCWRTPYLLQCFVSLVFISCMLPMPLSPRFLIAQGRIQQALATLKELHGSIAEYDSIQKEISMIDTTEKATLTDLMLGPVHRYQFWISVFIVTATSMTGTAAVWYYAPQIFIAAGLTNVSSSIAATAGSGIVSLIATAISLGWWIDHLGRRRLFLWGSAVMSISLFIVGVVFAHGGDPSTAALGMIIISIYVFIAAFAATWGVGTFVYPAEILSTRCRALGLAVVYGLSWVYSTLIGYGVPFFLSRSVAGVFFFFAACTATSIIGVCFIPETKGVALEELQPLFHSL